MDNNNSKKYVSIEEFLDLYPKMILKNENSLPSDIFLKFFNIKNSFKRRKSSIIIDNTQLNNIINAKNKTRVSSINIKTNSILNKNLIDKNRTSINDILNLNKHNYVLYKLIENQNIEKCIYLENEDLFLINKGIELQKRGLKLTNDIKRALELFFNKSELIQKLSKNLAIKNDIQEIDKNDNFQNKKNVKDKKTTYEVNIHHKVKNLISKLAENVVFEKYEKNKFIIRMDDMGKDCYFLISGRLSILKPVEYKRIEISYDIYFKYLLNLLDKNEKGIFKKVLELNYHFINIHDEDSLINLVKFYIQNKISIYSNISYNIFEKEKAEDLSLEKIELFLNEYKMNFESFGLSKKQVTYDINAIITDPENKNKNIQFRINNYFREIFRPSRQSQILLSQYNFLFDKKNYNFDDNINNTINYVTLIKYEIFMILEPGAFFGEMSLENEVKKRNASIRTEEDCVLVSLNNELYENILLDDNKKLKILQINFICNHFFFNNISPILFSKYYYPMFKFIIKKKEEIIYKQESPCNSLFLLKEGVIKYDINASIVDIHELINYLINSLQEDKYLKLDNDYIRTLKSKYLINKNLVTFKNNNIILKEKIIKKYKFELSTSNAYECLGIHEFFLKIGHISTCSVISKKAKFFEVSNDSLNKIISIEKEIVPDYYQLVLNKILAMIKRLFNIENICLKQIQEKINTNFFDINDTVFFTNLRINNDVNIINNNNLNLTEEKKNINIYNDKTISNKEETILTKEFENFGHIEESIIKSNNYSQIKFQNEQKNLKLMVDMKNYDNNNSFRSSSRIIDSKRIKFNKSIRKVKDNNDSKNKKNENNNLWDLKKNNSIIIRQKKNQEIRLNNSNSFRINKNRYSPKTIINIGNSYLSLPKLKRKLLLNRENIDNNNLNLSIVKNEFIKKSSLFHNYQSISSSKNKDKKMNNYNYCSKSTNINMKENFLPNIKKIDSFSANSFLTKIKNNINLTKIKSNSESKINHSKEIKIYKMEKKENILAKCIKSYYQKQKKKGYSSIINPLYNTIIRHKLLNNNLIKEKK